MTSKKRQEWEEALPDREKFLRANIRMFRECVKEGKLILKYVSGGAKDEIKKCINAQNVIARAMKHELERGKAARVKKSATMGFYCSKCSMFVHQYDNYCANCGSSCAGARMQQNMRLKGVEESEVYIL